MEQPKLLEFEDKKKDDVQEEQLEEQKKEKKQEIQVSDVKLIEEYKEKQQEVQEQKEIIKEEKQQIEQTDVKQLSEQKEAKQDEGIKEQEITKEIKEDKDETKFIEQQQKINEIKQQEDGKGKQQEEIKEKKEGNDTIIDKKVLIDRMKSKLEEENKKLEEGTINKIKDFNNLTEKIQLALIHQQIMKRKQLDKELEFDIQQLTKQYDKMAEPLYQEMNSIISGQKAIEVEDIKFLEEEDQKLLLENNQQPISNYWYKVLTNCEEIAKDIQKKDEDALKSLKNLQCIKENNSDSFTLVFEFAENNYFNACVLKKYFEMKDYDTAIYSQCEQKIEWKEYKNLTVKTQKKKQKNKKTGKTRTITKKIPTESFFNFFKDTIEEDYEDEDQEIMDLNYQLDIALYLIEETIPYSLEYYLDIKREESDSDENSQKSKDDDSDSEEEKVSKKKKQSDDKKINKYKKLYEEYEDYKKNFEKKQCNQQ